MFIQYIIQRGDQLFNNKFVVCLQFGNKVNVACVTRNAVFFQNCVEALLRLAISFYRQFSAEKRISTHRIDKSPIHFNTIPTERKVRKLSLRFIFSDKQ